MAAREPADTFPIRAFPYWVALGSLIFALGLFFANTVPALRDRQSLEQIESDLQAMRARLEGTIREDRLIGRPGDPGAFDMQAMLVSIDEQGYTPAELLQLHPARDETDATDGAAEAAHGDEGGAR